jgi:hypothetical protein
MARFWDHSTSTACSSRHTLCKLQVSNDTPQRRIQRRPARGRSWDQPGVLDEWIALLLREAWERARCASAFYSPHASPLMVKHWHRHLVKKALGRLQAEPQRRRRGPPERAGELASPETHPARRIANRYVRQLRDAASAGPVAGKVLTLDLLAPSFLGPCPPHSSSATPHRFTTRSKACSNC